MIKDIDFNPEMITTTFSGDTCCFPFSLGGFKKFLEAELGVYVKSLEIGNSIVTDYKSGYLIHPNRQVGWNFLVRAFFFFASSLLGQASTIVKVLRLGVVLPAKGKVSITTEFII